MTTPAAVTTQGRSGQPLQLDCTFTEDGTPTDAASVSLTITYGSSALQGAVVYGPVAFGGDAAPVTAAVWQTGTGAYSAVWPIPAGTPAGMYVANWTLTDSSGLVYSEPENFYVAGAAAPPVPSGDTGFWTGALTGGGQDIEFGAVDSDGICWLWQKLEGADSPPVQGAGVIPKTGDHGAWAAPQYYAALTPTLTVTASAPTQALRDMARAKLQRAVPVNGLAALRYDEPVPKVMYVRRSGQVTEAYPTLCDVTFTIGLVAPDPRKYAARQDSIVITPMPAGAGGGMVTPFSVPFTTASAPPPGSAVVTNDGTFGSPPVAVLTGPVTAPGLINTTTGDTVSWSTLTLAEGEQAVVDFLNRETWVTPAQVITTPGSVGDGGGTYWPADLSSSWWVLEPGDNAVEVGGQAGTGCSAAIWWSGAWI